MPCMAHFTERPPRPRKRPNDCRSAIVNQQSLICNPLLFPVASLDDLPDDGVHAVTLPSGTRVCLVRCGGVISAFLDECTHQGMSLSAGEVLRDGTLECPWHGARFDCRTGAVRRGPAEEAVRTFPVLLENGRILVDEEPAT